MLAAPIPVEDVGCTGRPEYKLYIIGVVSNTTIKRLWLYWLVRKYNQNNIVLVLGSFHYIQLGIVDVGCTVLGRFQCSPIENWSYSGPLAVFTSIRSWLYWAAASIKSRKWWLYWAALNVTSLYCGCTGSSQCNQLFIAVVLGSAQCPLFLCLPYWYIGITFTVKCET